MEFEEYINYLKDLQNTILNYIDSEESVDEEYENLINFFKKYNIPKNREEFQQLINLMLIITHNYHRMTNTFPKIERILLFFGDYIKSTFSNQEIFDIFKDSKPILYFLFDHQFLTMDKPLTNIILQKNDQNKLSYYLFPLIKSKINKKKKQKMENEIPKIPNDIFIDNCKIGENDSTICNLIRKDLIEDFIVFVTKNNTKLTSHIKPSIFETNLFLIDKNPTLIEYAAFYGSIEIFQYLRLNNVDLNPSLWFYAIHGKNGEIIHLLEEDEIKPPDNSYQEIFEEAIKCHHNDIAEYILNNYIDTKDDTKYYTLIYRYSNFHFFPTDIITYISNLPKNDKAFNIFNAYWVNLNITIPTTENIINESFFKGFSNIKEITFPSSIVSIQKLAFQGCSSLTSLNFSEDSELRSIETFSFSDCVSLCELNIPSKVEIIEISAFKGCAALRSVHFPSSIKSIGCSAFQRCSALENVVFEDNSHLKSIGNYAFNCCNKLVNISIPSSVMVVGEGALPYKLQLHKPNFLFE